MSRDLHEAGLAASRPAFDAAMQFIDRVLANRNLAPEVCFALSDALFEWAHFLAAAGYMVRTAEVLQRAMAALDTFVTAP